jgi:hypothetical protein
MQLNEQYFIIRGSGFVFSNYPTFLLMHSQLLERLKSESKYKTAEGGGVRARSLVHNTLRGRGVC